MDAIEHQVLGSSDSWAQAEAEILELCRERGYPENRREEILTALEEALCNACEHAHGGDAAISIGLKAWFAGVPLWIEVSDGGPGLLEVPPPPNLARKLSGEETPRGWGLFLMRSFASAVEFASRIPGGCTVRLRFDPAAPASPAKIRILEG